MQNKFYILIIINTIFIYFVECQLPFVCASSNMCKKDSDALIQQMKKCSASGDHVNSIVYSKQVLKFLDMNHDAYWEALSILTHAYQSTGQHAKALPIYETILPFVKLSNSLDHQAHFFNDLGDLYLSLGNVHQAVENFEKAVQKASESKNLAIQAMTLNNIGNAYMSYAQYQQNKQFIKYYQKAMAAYRQCINIIDHTSGNIGLKSNVITNMVLGEFQHDDLTSISDLLKKAYHQNLLLPENAQKVDNLLSLIWISIQLLKKESWPEAISLSKQDIFRMAYQMATIVERISYHLNMIKYKSEVNAYMAQLYEMRGRLTEALTLTRKAIFFSEQANNKDILYLWQSQLGRLFYSLGDIDQAISSYKDSINTLKPIKTALLTGLRSNATIFEDKIKPVYLGLSKIYFEQATNATGYEIKQKYLKLAWTIMEQMKSDELQNFFKDPCMAESKDEQKVIEKIHPNTAIIYPILYEDHLVILLKISDRLKHVVISEDSTKINAAIYRMSNKIRNWDLFEDDAIVLYQLLIHPIESYLFKNKIETIVVAADGGFCLIPFAALFDGDHYLIEKYAIVTIPSLALTNTDAVFIKKNSALLAGFSKSKTKRTVFEILPNVMKEINTIKSYIGGKKLVGESFNKANIQLEFENNSFSIIHLATHGKFGRIPEQTFLLTYDDIITLNELQDFLEIHNYKKPPVELMTLSACETAAGNERIAFGMAGIAVKTGVKSVIATLWQVDDTLSVKLLTEFYSQLSRHNMTKAKAMQFAQKKMLEDFHFDNPSKWAAFLLIGNWL